MGGAGDDAGNSITTDAAGNVYTTGHFEGTADFDPGAGTFTLASAGKKDIFISKLDAAGNFQWAIAFGDTGIDRGSFIATDAAGNVYVTGFFSGTVDFDPGPGTSVQSTLINQSAFILKISTSGNLVWSKSIAYFGLKYAVALALDLQGNVYVTGDFNGSADFDPGVFGTYFLNAQGGSYVLKLNNAGTFLWAKVNGRSVSSAGECVYSTAIAVDAAQNVYTTGHFIGVADFDPSTASYTMGLLPPMLSFDPFVSKLDANGN